MKVISYIKNLYMKYFVKKKKKIEFTLTKYIEVEI